MFWRRSNSIYVSDTLLFKCRSDLEFDSGELIWIEINFSKLQLVLVYHLDLLS